MPRLRTLDEQVAGIVEKALRAELRAVIGPLARAVRRLERKLARTAGSRAAPGRPGRRPRFVECQVGRCGRKPVARGFCSMHYYRFRKQGTLGAMTSLVEAGKAVREARGAAGRGGRRRKTAGAPRGSRRRAAVRRSRRGAKKG